MDANDKEMIDKAKKYLTTHKIELVLIGLGALIGSYIGYYWWLIDFIWSIKFQFMRLV